MIPQPAIKFVQKSLVDRVTTVQNAVSWVFFFGGGEGGSTTGLFGALQAQGFISIVFFLEMLVLSSPIEFLSH